MSAVSRGIRNLYRNPVRGALIVLILGLSIGLFLSMINISASVEEEAEALKTRTLNDIEIRAAGSTAMGRGTQPLQENITEEIEGLPGIVKIEKYLYYRVFAEGKEHSVEILAGVEPGAELRPNSHGEIGVITITAGRDLRPGDGGKNVALIGKIYAEQNQAALGDIIEINGTKVEVVGTFDAGFVFGNNHVFMPLSLAQEITGLEGIASVVFITVDSVENVRKVGRSIKSVLGERVDVLYGKYSSRYASEVLSSVQESSAAGAVLASVVAALIVLFTMVLVARERTREIGVLKAIGASNGDVAKQFAAEALAIAALGTFLGLVIFAVAGSSLSEALLDLPSISTTPFYGSMGEQPVSTLLSYEVSLSLVIYAVAAMLILGMLGSLYPVLRAVRMNPAEAIHHE